MPLNENIKKYRKLRNLTQKGLGDAINRSEVSIQKYEAKKNPVEPPYSLIQEIAAVLEVEVGELLGVEESERMRFESDFSIDDFDPFIIEAFNKFKERFKVFFPDVKISNSDLIQCIVTDYLARYEAELIVYKAKFMNEFIYHGDQLLTGKEHYDKLFDRYYRNKMDEWKVILLNTINSKIQKSKDGVLDQEELALIKQFIDTFDEKSLPIEARLALENSSKGVD
ncbi:MAG: helix-turn-helix transcriptional regulator [Ignavibacteria bacterium]|nr:helix-turn-helix transcriptional regulator [Ignavibacteria bacterium]